MVTSPTLHSSLHALASRRLPSVCLGLACGLIALITGAAHATDVRVRLSQESAPGAGDFGTNILGVVTAFPLGESVGAFYQYGTPVPASYNGNAFASMSNVAHLFVAANTDLTVGGIRVGFVFDGLIDGDFNGGRAETRMTAILPTGGLTLDLVDDPSDISNDRYIVEPGGAAIAADQRWAPTIRTDGYVVGGLACGSVVHFAFTSFDDPLTPPIAGLEAFLAISADGSSLPLALAEDRRVQIEVLPPETCIGDLSCDGTIDNIDVAALLSAWGLPGISDVNGDGTTDSLDLSAMLGQWGVCP